MKIRLSVSAKAVFLTFVFLLNTMVGFACSFRFDMDFSKEHHNQGHDTTKTVGHSHPVGTKKRSHQHHHKAKEKTETKENCYKDEIAKFVDVDKQLNKSIIAKVPLLFPIVIAAVFYRSTTLQMTYTRLKTDLL